MATTYYKYNQLTRVLTAEPRYIVTIDGRTIVNPMAEQYATLRDAYPKGADAPMPEPQEGKVVEYGGYALGESDRLWHKQWVLVDEPPPPPRRFDPYKLQEALIKEGVWARVRTWLQSDPDNWDRWVKAPDIDEDEPLFAAAVEAAKTGFGWTDEKIESVLSEALA